MPCGTANVDKSMAATRCRPTALAGCLSRRITLCCNVLHSRYGLGRAGLPRSRRGLRRCSAAYRQRSHVVITVTMRAREAKSASRSCLFQRLDRRIRYATQTLGAPVRTCRRSVARKPPLMASLITVKVPSNSTPIIGCPTIPNSNRKSTEFATRFAGREHRSAPRRC
jgi:hypothetical protein